MLKFNFKTSVHLLYTCLSTTNLLFILYSCTLVSFHHVHIARVGDYSLAGIPASHEYFFYINVKYVFSLSFIPYLLLVIKQKIDHGAYIFPPLIFNLVSANRYLPWVILKCYWFFFFFCIVKPPEKRDFKHTNQQPTWKFLQHWNSSISPHSFATIVPLVLPFVCDDTRATKRFIKQ